MEGGRFASLDGARAFAILLVIAWHINPALPGLWRIDYGNLGVRIFFVISGFLITALLIRERERTGKISLWNFYRRRLLRIAPAYYAYLAAVVILIGFGIITATLPETLPALGFFSNYKPIPLALGATWSLSVEEQFYFLWPNAFVFLGTKRALIGCMALLAIAPVFRVLSDVGDWPTNPRYAFESVSDALATGCILAIARERLWSFQYYRQAVRWAVAIPLAALVLMAIRPGSIAAAAVALPLLNAGIAMTMDRYMRYPKSFGGRVLNMRPVMWIGTISYSLYLWQQLFMFSIIPVWMRLGGCFLCATGSYYLIERPVIRAHTSHPRMNLQPLSKPA